MDLRDSGTEAFVTPQSHHTHHARFRQLNLIHNLNHALPKAETDSQGFMADRFRKTKASNSLMVPYDRVQKYAPLQQLNLRNPRMGSEAVKNQKKAHSFIQTSSQKIEAPQPSQLSRNARPYAGEVSCSLPQVLDQNHYIPT